MPFFYYYDPYYWMILVPAMLIALLAQLNVSSTFNRYSRMASRRGFTGAQAAEDGPPVKFPQTLYQFRSRRPNE